MTQSRQEIEAEISQLRQRLSMYAKDKVRLEDLEKQLDRTLCNLNIYQEELRDQNEQLNQAHSQLEGLLVKYSVLFDASPVGYLVIDENQHIIENNHAAADLLNAKKEHLTFQTLLAFAPKKSIPIIGDHFNRVILSGYASDELLIQTLANRLVPCILQSHRITNPDTGKPVSLTALLDITERKNAEQKIVSLAEQNRQILFSAAEGILGIGREGLIIFSNPAAESILGWSSKGLLGQEPLQILEPEDARGIPISLADSAFSKLLTDGKTRQVTDEKFRRRNGQLFPVEYVVAPTMEGESITGMVVTFQDVTERQQFEKELVHAKEEAEAGSRAKTEFLSIASHELRTPMNAIIGMSELLSDSKLNNDQKEYVKTIRQSAFNLLSIINDILELSGMDSGKLFLEHSRFDLPDLIQNVFDIVAPTAREKGIVLDLSLQASVPTTLRGDDKRLRQVLINLLGNAIKFSNEGTVQLSVEQVKPETDPLQIQFSISDTGVGIDKPHLEKIFHPFFQVDTSETRPFGGVGLGLTVSQGFVQYMGGKIQVESEPGKGSIFSFVLPVSTSPPQPPLLLPFATETLDGIPSEAKILIVEDDPVNQLLTVKLLRRWGLIHTEIAGNGQIALERLVQESFALVLMDIQMPIMDGLTACRHFRIYEEQQRPGKHIPIIAVTAYSLEDHRASCLMAGMDDFLTKPLIRQDLKETLRRWLGTENAPPSLPETDIHQEQDPILNDSILSQLRQEMEEDFRMVVELFLEILPQRRKTIREAAQRSDGKTIHEETHPLKSASRQVGLIALSVLTETIDNLVRAGQVEQAKALLPQFEARCDQSVAALNAELDKPETDR